MSRSTSRVAIRVSGNELAAKLEQALRDLVDRAAS